MSVTHYRGVVRHLGLGSGGREGGTLIFIYIYIFINIYIYILYICIYYIYICMYLCMYAYIFIYFYLLIELTFIFLSPKTYFFTCLSFLQVFLNQTKKSFLIK